MKIKLAKYECLKCELKYEDNPGPTFCPVCYHIYVRWLNYDAMRKEWDKLESETLSPRPRKNRGMYE